MKTILIILCLSLFIPMTTFAQAPPIGSLAIYADQARTHWCVDGTPPYETDMWIYLTIGENGAAGFSFDLEIPSNVQVLSLDLNREEGDMECLPPECEEGISGAFPFCYTPPLITLVWVVKATLRVLDCTPSVVRIVGNPLHGTVYIQNCDYSLEYPLITTELYINYPASSPVCGSVPFENTTWGAIKALCR